MKIRAKKISQEMKKTRWIMILAFGIIIIIAALVPHIFKGHVIQGVAFSEDYEQSTIILLESFFALVFYRIYRRRINSLATEREEIEKHLQSSYEHIGKVNNELELLKNFIATYPPNGNGKIEEKNSYEKLLSYMLISVAKASEGFVRFVDVRSGKTLKEFHYSNGANGDHSSNLKLSNSLITKGVSNHASEKSVEVVESYYHESPIKCILCFPKKERNFDRSLLQLLLTHIHLLFLASRCSVN